jgi:hypothetical protein
MNWAAAEVYCVTVFGDHLASFHSAAEYTVVMAGLEACHGTLPLGWIALTDITQKGTFVWSDGSLLVWTNWETLGYTQPDSLFGEHCVETTIMYARYNRMTWNDFLCTSTRSYIQDGNEPFGAICKKNSNTPTPSTASPTTLAPTTPSPTQAPITCAVGWLIWGSNCYRLFPALVQWSSARSACLAEGLGADLASISSAQENAFVSTFLPAGRDAWLGGTDILVEGDWTWSDGSPWSYTNRGIVELNGGEHCLKLHPELTYQSKWNINQPCSINIPFICKY